MNVNVVPQNPGGSATPAFEIERLGVKLGAEIRGLDLREPMNAGAFEAFEAALIEHKVLMLRDQHLTTAQHVALSRVFGELEVHPMRPQGEFPEILVLDNRKDNPVLSTDVCTATRRSGEIRPNTRSCAARSCRSWAAIRCGPAWKPPTTG
jgi:hypothetical protein